MNLPTFVDRRIRVICKQSAVCAALFVIALPVMANGTAATQPASISLLQVLFGLAVVIGLILCSGWLIRKISPGITQGSLIRVVTAASVGQRERVVVVEINDNWLVLGVTPNQINLLQSMPKASEQQQETIRATPNFIEKLKEATKRYARP